MRNIFLTLSILFCFLNSNCFANEFGDSYNEAWKITKENFYDSTMNHQNWNYWKKHYEGKIKTSEDLNVATDSMLHSLDDIYTRYLLKADFNQENSDIHDDAVSVSEIPLYYNTRIPKHVKYIRIDSMMNKNLANEIKEIVEKAEKDTELKGYIIDLRNNGGGLVKNACEIASLFMKNKIVLYAKTNNKNVKSTTQQDKYITDKPVVILINGYTASACEVFTGAMQDNDRAYVIGTTSFGKGIIQQIKKLSDGSGLHITVMAYYTPKNNEINNKGIKPNEEVYFTRKDIFFHRDVQLLRAIKYLKNIK